MNPLYIIGAILGTLSTAFIVAFALMKDKKQSIGFERNMKDIDILKRLLKYARPYWKQFLFVILLVAFTIASDIVLPLILGDVTRTLGEVGFEYKPVLRDALIYFAVLAISLACTFFMAVILQKTGQRIISTMRQQLFVHIEGLSHSQLNAIPVGKLVTRVCNDTNSVSMMFTGILVNLVKNIFLTAGFLVAMFAVNVKLTLIVLCFVPFIVLFTVIFRKFSRKAYRKVKNNMTDINTYLSENLSGIKVTQSFNQEATKNNQFIRKNKALGKSLNQEIFVFGVFRPAVYVLYILTVIAMLWVGANDTISEVSFAGQVVSYSTIVIFYQYIASFFTPIQNLAEQFNRMQSAFASSEKIFSILDMQPEIVDSEDAVELDEIKGDIEFKDVWFYYIPDEWVLKGVSFKVDAGSTCAFVGATGSGKSTILSLIVRNYDIQKGQILIDGVDIKKIKISSLRKHFGQMLQDVFVFSGTVRSNIVLREESITDEQVEEACKYVNADKFIAKLEKGLDYEVRERGNNFSAGERQLLSFARTVAHKPSVMILDEATANIDTETEVLIQDSLEKMMNIGTMLIVAHRLSTIQHADNIIVLQSGEILEQGTHQELLHKKGKYYSLYRLQYKKAMLEKGTAV
ncbi:MAG: ABC transporter ATP-binding protein [Clostridia bacterium]|nr:ABC transporter ATP-binding protein [Clostridia bacterium]